MNPLWVLRNCRDGNFIFFGQVFASLAFEQKRFAGFDGEHGDFRGGASFKSFRADAGDVEAHVVIQLGDFHGDRAAVFAGQFAAARQAFVRAFKAFDGQHRAVLHDDELADFQPRNFLGDA